MAICNDKPKSSTEAYKVMELTIHKLAHKWTRNNFQDYDDVFMAGCEGLMYAYNRFDSAKECAFSSYAYQWISACMKDKVNKDWKQYNNTSYKEVDDKVMGEDGYDIDIDATIDNERKLNKLSDVDKQIAIARQEGYSFREIAEALTEGGDPHTLHQVRNRWIAALS
jgi:RNA polymerase sigma factor (sigma-70 family)